MKPSNNEIIILKCLDPGYKYVARDSNGDLNVYELKPKKSILKGFWDGERYAQINMFRNHFKWISWDDKEPVLIKDVIMNGRDKSRTTSVED